MKKKLRMMGTVLTAAALLTACVSMTGCGKDNSSSESDSLADAGVSSKALKGIYDIFLTDEDYGSYKDYFPDAKFDEKLDGDSIVISISGTDGQDGTYTFPVENGYIVCNINSGNNISAMLFSFIMSSVGKYYGINPTLYSGYLNGMETLGKESKYYEIHNRDDNTGTIKLKIAEKPEMKELEEMYIDEKALEQFSDDAGGIVTNIGKVLANITTGGVGDTLSIAVGEYEKNTELTYKSVISIVNKFKPKGYEEFIEKFSQLTEISSDNYKVSFDGKEFRQRHDVEQPDGYKYVYVTFGDV